MRKADMEVLVKVRDALIHYLPKEEYQLLNEYLTTYNRLCSVLEKQKASYQKNAQYYRDKSKQWKQENPGRAKRHSDDWLTRKKQKKER